MPAEEGDRTGRNRLKGPDLSRLPLLPELSAPHTEISTQESAQGGHWFIGELCVLAQAVAIGEVGMKEASEGD